MAPQYLKDWTLPKGWPWKAQFEHRAMLVPGDILSIRTPGGGGWGEPENQD